MFSSRKAQAALEYLMTYGWALIMVSTIIGVLVFIVGTPTQTGFDCKSSDLLKIDFAGARFDADSGSGNVRKWENGKIVLRNLTGGRIQITSLEKDAYFSALPEIGGKDCVAITTSNTVQIAPGATFAIENFSVLYDPNSSDFSCDPNLDPYDRDFGNIYITYLDQTGLSHNLTLSCRNFPLN